jgi:hypothetical protein
MMNEQNREQIREISSGETGEISLQMMASVIPEQIQFYCNHFNCKEDEFYEYKFMAMTNMGMTAGEIRRFYFESCLQGKKY